MKLELNLYLGKRYAGKKNRGLLMKMNLIGIIKSILHINRKILNLYMISMIRNLSKIKFYEYL